jgi:hypothetical protein
MRDDLDPATVISKLQGRLKMALLYTHPRHDEAHWRVGAIELLPEADREHFYNRLSEAKSEAAS